MMMETISPSDFYGYSIFCDDIRQEANGKVTFVGVYTRHMVVHGQFPVLLPKLGVWIQYNQRPEHITKPIRFAIFLPTDAEDSPSIVMEVPPEQTEEAIAKSGYLAKDFSLVDDKDPVFVGLGTQTVFSPFVIPSPGLIKVRAIRDDKLVRLGGLAVYGPEGPSAPPPQ
jgi:hypothetical protein